MRFDGLVDAVRRTAGWSGEEEVFAAMLDSLLAASDLDRVMLLRVEGLETRAVSIRARCVGTRRPSLAAFARTLLAAALEREGTVRMEADPDIAGGQSLVISGAGEAFCRRVESEEDGVVLAIYGDRPSLDGDSEELVAWFDAIADLLEVAMRMQRGRRAEAERARLSADMHAARAVQELLLPATDGHWGKIAWNTSPFPGTRSLETSSTCGPSTTVFTSSSVT